MENFRPLRQLPSHADGLYLVHHCTEFAQDFSELGAQEIVRREIIYWFNLK